MNKQIKIIVFVIAILCVSLACIAPSLDESEISQFPTSVPLEQIIAQTANAAQQQTQSFYTPIITMTLPPPTAQGTSTYTPTVTKVSKDDYVEWMTNVALTPTAPLVWSTPLFAPPVVVFPNSAPLVYSPNSSVQSVLEENGYTVTRSDSDGVVYLSSCGSHAVWLKNKPKSATFFIPAVYPMCDAEGMMKPVVSSTMTLYPTSVTNWLSRALQDSRIIRGEILSDVVDGYLLALYFVQKDNSLLFSVSAPREF